MTQKHFSETIKGCLHWRVNQHSVCSKYLNKNVNIALKVHPKIMPVILLIVNVVIIQS